MTGELIINGQDAYPQWGVVMGKGFIDAISLPAEMKPYVENSSRLEHGKKVIIGKSPKVKSREVSLIFNIHGKTQTEFETNKNAFISEMQKGAVSIKIPSCGNDVYNLIYKKSVSYAQNTKRTFCKLGCRFEEPNPMNRI